MLRWVINKVAKGLFMIWTFSGCGIIMAAWSTVLTCKGKSISTSLITGFMFFLMYAMYASFAFGVANITDKQK